MFSLKEVVRAFGGGRRGRLTICRRNLADDGHNRESLFNWRKPVGHSVGISIYNPGMRRKVPLVLRNPRMATWYTCGPTVYDSTHLGHASTYVKVDILQRILRDYFKINLVTAMNITDVDDKIIMRASLDGQDWLQMARDYEAEFRRDMLRLNVKPPDVRSHVTTSMPAIIQFIQELIDDNYAYITSSNSVYFDVSKSKEYGKLAKVTIEEETSSNEKRNSADFALWKARKTQKESSWQAPWGGEGRPGWHIECSAIAGLFFGRTVDFHAGGLDLKFPHHENEEAQCCARFKTDQWVNYWLHTGQLHIAGDQRKMSKSLQNTISVTELLKKYTADEFRMACLLCNYRNAMHYSDDLMQTARQTLQKFKNFHADLSAYVQFLKPVHLLDEGALRAQLSHTMTEFDDCMRDDFNTSRAVSVMLDQMSSISRCINDQKVDAQEEPAYCMDLLMAAGNFINRAMLTFGVTDLAPKETLEEQVPSTTHRIDPSILVDDVLSVRGRMRQEAFSGEKKNSQLLAACDELRTLLQQHGIQVRDHKQGSSWVFAVSCPTDDEKSKSSVE
ncbi:probable cysteine--tRNA ligase, mitochondrial isoform X1 [Drosophila bipectinata]|uniref:probable cysteine--tRNA ligase, mitochondrial isoform X1 n=2 Tax=Drosophila bipectinata TaxID=42026 RepID=UPI001C898255|nr:probable cysteine--tRNA ligase, mitochondrial [Drosophila bipectinata]